MGLSSIKADPIRSPIVRVSKSSLSPVKDQRAYKIILVFEHSPDPVRVPWPPLLGPVRYQHFTKQWLISALI